MSRPLDPGKLRSGKICSKHPELGGLRFKANATCVQCQRDVSKARLRALGIQERKKLPESEAKERIRQRDLLRNQKRRQDPEYKASQIERKKAWRLANPEKHLATSRAYDALQLATNIQRKISKNLRHRLRKAMLGETKGISAVRDLGLSIDEFKKYVANKFTAGMSWENYGEWHLDHIRPLISFDLTDMNQAKIACHYTNIQPLWARDNIAKGGKTIPQTVGVA